MYVLNVDYIITQNIGTIGSTQATLSWTNAVGTVVNAALGCYPQTLNGSQTYGETLTQVIHPAAGTPITIAVSNTGGNTYDIWVDGLAYY